MIIKNAQRIFFFLTGGRFDLPFVEIEDECAPEEHCGGEIDHAHQISVVQHTHLVRSYEHEEAYHPDEHYCKCVLLRKVRMYLKGSRGPTRWRAGWAGL